MELLEAFFRTHSYLIEHNNASVRRGLMDEINWEDRLIGIKGTRGVGKTTFLLSYAKEKFGKDNRKCLYVNMNNLHKVDKFCCLIKYLSSQTGVMNCESVMTYTQNLKLFSQAQV